MTTLVLKNRKTLLVDWDQCDPDCPGWLHMDSPFEIEACDACDRFKNIINGDGRDDQARKAHRLECGCKWPDVDYQDIAMSWIHDLIAYDLEDPISKQSSPYRDEILKLRQYCEERGSDFINNIPYAIYTCKGAISKVPDSTPPMMRFRKLLSILQTIWKKIRDGELILKDFQNSEAIMSTDYKLFEDRKHEFYICESSSQFEIGIVERDAIRHPDSDGVCMISIPDTEALTAEQVVEIAVKMIQPTLYNVENPDKFFSDVILPKIHKLFR